VEAGPGAGFQLVAPEMLVLLLHMAEAFEDGLQFVTPPGIGQGMFQVDQFVV